ncbi:zinc finger protein DZIP1L-like isoform X3 [Anneissia japonica]|uniref:zinc finger protein DZIP1L-like isoform X3 n=1 Tax=Anneissia japonica TaxID=1529436 RepID=UPI0014256386|nr:zinc finger protein DZIP1L-like isoform X3 [Anneissia japonica]
MQSQYYPSSNGFTPRQQPQSSNHGPGNLQQGFRFSRRTERVDWRKIAAVDIERITADGDWNVLQHNIQHVTYCNVDQELDLRGTDPTFVKLFKLAQMIIEYLMISQEHLGSVVNTLEQKLLKAVEAHNNTTVKINKQSEEIKQLKQENKLRRKMLASQQSFIQSNENNYHKCLYCPKAFVHVSYLHAHVERKHPEHSTTQESQYKLANEKQELEIGELREKLKMTQRQLEEEAATYQKKLAEKEALEKETQDQFEKHQLDIIRQEQIEAQKHEMNSLRDMFMKELKEMNEKYSESQHALVDLQQRYGKTSMLGTLQDEDEIAEYKEKLHDQHVKYDRLKKRLEEEVTSMKSSMLQEMKKQDKDWKEKNKEVKHMYRKKISKLENALEDAKRTMVMEREGSKDEIRQHYEQQLLSMKKKSKQQEQELKAREKEISELQKRMKQAVDQVQSLEVEKKASQRQAAKLQQSNNTRGRILSPPPEVKTQPPSSTEEEETDEDEESEGVGKMHVSSPDAPEMYGTLEDSMLNTDENDDDDEYSATSLPQRKQRVATLDSHPNKTRIIDGMKVTLDSELTKNLQKRGVGKNAEGITSRSLENKLQVLKKERQELAKKYPKFYDIREKCRRDMELMSKDRAKGRKPTMMQPKSSVSLPPRSPSPFAKYNQRLSSTASLPRTKSSDITHQSMYGVPKTKNTGPPVAPRDSQPPPVAPRSPDSRNNLQPRAKSALKESFSSEEDDLSSTGDDDNWDSEEVSELKEISPSKTAAGGSGVRPTSSQRQDPSGHQIQSPDMMMESLSDTGDQSTSNFDTKSGGQKVSELTRSIEFQLSGRKGHSRPVGGVDLSGTAGSGHLAAPAYIKDSSSRSPSPQIPTIPDKFDSDEEDSFVISSLEESERAVPKSKPQPAPRTGGGGKRMTGDTDISSNTFGTSVWGSSSKGADKGSTHGEASTGKSSLVSVTDWDDDDDDDDLGLSDL